MTWAIVLSFVLGRLPGIEDGCDEGREPGACPGQGISATYFSHFALLCAVNRDSHHLFGVPSGRQRTGTARQRVKVAGVEFDQVTQADQEQQKILDLMKVKL